MPPSARTHATWFRQRCYKRGARLCSTGPIIPARHRGGEVYRLLMELVIEVAVCCLALSWIGRWLNRKGRGKKMIFRPSIWWRTLEDTWVGSSKVAGGLRSLLEKTGRLILVLRDTEGQGSMLFCQLRSFFCTWWSKISEVAKGWFMCKSLVWPGDARNVFVSFFLITNSYKFNCVSNEEARPQVERLQFSNPCSLKGMGGCGLSHPGHLCADLSQVWCPWGWTSKSSKGFPESDG